MVFVCVLGMLLCLAWSVARAEPFDYDPSHTPSDGLLHVAAGAGIAASISIYTMVATKGLDGDDDYGVMVAVRF